MYGGGKGLERRGWVTTYVLPPYVDQLLLLLHLPCFVDTGLRPDVAELMMARLSNCPSVAPSFPPRQRVVLPPARIPPANPAVSQSVSIPGSEHSVTRALVGQHNTYRNVITHQQPQ